MKLNVIKRLANFAFNFNLRPYILGFTASVSVAYSSVGWCGLTLG